MQALCEHARGRSSAADRDRPLGKTIAPSARSGGRARRSCWIERDFLARLDLVGELRLDLVERNRRGQHDPALGRAAGDLGHGEERLTRERRNLIDDGAAAVGKQEPAVTPRFLAIRSG